MPRDEGSIAVVKANLFRDGLAVGGRMRITNRGVLFEPHLFSLEWWRPLELLYEDISEVREGGATLGFLKNRLLIRTHQGVEHLIAVDNRDSLIALIQKSMRGEVADLSDEPVLKDDDTGIGGVLIGLSDGLRHVAGIGIDRFTGVKDDRRSTPEGLSSELERLAALHDKGVLTDEEFRRAKARLFDG